MRGSLRFMPESWRKFEVAEHAGDGAEAVVWAVRNGLLRQLAAVAQLAATQLRRKLGNDASDPAFIFAEPRGGYRMVKGEEQEGDITTPHEGTPYVDGANDLS